MTSVPVKGSGGLVVVLNTEPVNGSEAALSERTPAIPCLLKAPNLQGQLCPEGGKHDLQVCLGNPPFQCKGHI